MHKLWYKEGEKTNFHANLLAKRTISPEASVKNTRKFWFGFRNKTMRFQNMNEKFHAET